MSEYVEILPDGTRRTVKYQRADGHVSQLIKSKARLRWLEKHPQHAKKNELSKLNGTISLLSRKLNQTRQTVAQSKYSPRSAGTKGRFQTNKRPNNHRALAGFVGDAGASGNRTPPTPDCAAAPSLSTGCEDTPKGCQHAAGGQTAVGLHRPEQ